MNKTDYKVVHGMLKTLIVNSINIVHKKLSKNLKINKDTKTGSVELVNLSKAYDEGMKQFEKYNNKGFDNSSKGLILRKFKDIAFAVLKSDTAYYFLFDYILREYCIVKFGKYIDKDKLMDMFDNQSTEMLDKK